MAQQDLPFSRDLGYLDKFLAGLGAHAETLPEPQRSELRRLVAAEVDHWKVIKGLLSGEAPVARQAAPAPPADPAPMAQRGLTVGSLLKRP